MRSPWLRCALAAFLSIKCQQTTALPATPIGSNDQASIASQSSQNLTSLANSITLDSSNTTITNTSLFAWPPLPFTVPLPSRTGVMQFSQSDTREGTPFQLNIALRMAGWLSHRLTTWDRRDIIFRGLFTGTTTNGPLQLLLKYTPRGTAAKADDMLDDVLQVFFQAQKDHGCRDVLANYAFQAPETVQGSGSVALRFNRVELRPSENVGSEVGKPVIFPIQSSNVVRAGMLEVLSGGTAFTPPELQFAILLVKDMLARVLQYQDRETFATARSWDDPTRMQIIYRTAPLVPMPAITGYEAAVALKEYGVLLERYGGSMINVDIWLGSTVYANFEISRYAGRGVGNGTVVEGGEITRGPSDGTVGWPEVDEQLQTTSR